MGIIDLNSGINKTEFEWDSEIAGPEIAWDSATPEFIDKDSETKTTVDRDGEVFNGD